MPAETNGANAGEAAKTIDSLLRLLELFEGKTSLSHAEQTTYINLISTLLGKAADNSNGNKQVIRDRLQQHFTTIINNYTAAVIDTKDPVQKQASAAALMESFMRAKDPVSLAFGQLKSHEQSKDDSAISLMCAQLKNVVTKLPDIKVIEAAYQRLAIIIPKLDKNSDTPPATKATLATERQQLEHKISESLVAPVIEVFKILASSIDTMPPHFMRFLKEVHFSKAALAEAAGDKKFSAPGLTMIMIRVINPLLTTLPDLSREMRQHIINLSAITQYIANQTQPDKANKKYHILHNCLELCSQQTKSDVAIIKKALQPTSDEMETAKVRAADKAAEAKVKQATEEAVREKVTEALIELQQSIAGQIDSQREVNDDKLLAALHKIQGKISHYMTTKKDQRSAIDVVNFINAIINPSPHDDSAQEKAQLDTIRLKVQDLMSIVETVRTNVRAALSAETPAPVGSYATMAASLGPLGPPIQPREHIQKAEQFAQSRENKTALRTLIKEITSFINAAEKDTSAGETNEYAPALLASLKNVQSAINPIVKSSKSIPGIELAKAAQTLTGALQSHMDTNTTHLAAKTLQALLPKPTLPPANAVPEPLQKPAPAAKISSSR